MTFLCVKCDFHLIDEKYNSEREYCKKGIHVHLHTSNVEKVGLDSVSPFKA